MILLASTVKHLSSDKIMMALVLERKHGRFPRDIYIYGKSWQEVFSSTFLHIWQILAGSIFKYFPEHMATKHLSPANDRRK